MYWSFVLTTNNLSRGNDAARLLCYAINFVNKYDYKFHAKYRGKDRNGVLIIKGERKTVSVTYVKLLGQRRIFQW